MNIHAHETKPLIMKQDIIRPRSSSLSSRSLPYSTGHYPFFHQHRITWLLFVLYIINGTMQYAVCLLTIFFGKHQFVHSCSIVKINYNLFTLWLMNVWAGYRFEAITDTVGITLPAHALWLNMCAFLLRM